MEALNKKALFCLCWYLSLKTVPVWVQGINDVVGENGKLRQKVEGETCEMASAEAAKLLASEEKKAGGGGNEAWTRGK